MSCSTLSLLSWKLSGCIKIAVFSAIYTDGQGFQMRLGFVLKQEYWFSTKNALAHLHSEYDCTVKGVMYIPLRLTAWMLLINRWKRMNKIRVKCSKKNVFSGQIVMLMQTFVYISIYNTIIVWLLSLVQSSGVHCFEFCATSFKVTEGFQMESKGVLLIFAKKVSCRKFIDLNAFLLT